MLQLRAHLYQSPIYLPCATSTQDEITLSGCVHLLTPSGVRIPGLEVLLISAVQRRSEVGGKWSHCEVKGYFKTTVLDGDHWIDSGKTEFEFRLAIKRQIPYTRSTHFDRVVHTLHAIVPNHPPAYHKCSSKLPNGTILPRLRWKQQKIIHHPISRVPILAMSAENVHVYGPKSYLDQVSTSSWSERSRISSIGVDVSLRSEEQHATLGSPYTIYLTLRNLPPNLTLHGWDILLYQLTQPVKPNEPNVVFKDVYTIGQRNQSFTIYRLPGRPRPSNEEYLWRGSAALTVGGDSPTSSPDSTFATTLPTRLPSPAIGGLPSCPDGTEYASVQHLLSFMLHYSIIGEGMNGDQLGGPLTEAEGAVRSWIYERPIHILSDLHGLAEAPSPVYSTSSLNNLDDALPGDFSHMAQSMKIPHMVSINKSRSGFMRPAGVDIEKLKVKIQEHWVQTAGLCACFVEPGHQAFKASLEDELNARSRAVKMVTQDL
ncbi:hypothetical protein V865_008484 [Kwoniella europaea PYCC6329]|uniref:Arrestin-like N-terminal domain-containing protein n=1 Tax=Kwoniella europaea PYCC6329 TaxID=1423913 RepID=A0AAX4KW67_9TREE